MMRKFRTALFALGLALMSTGVLAAPQAYKIHVDGLACPFCAYGIEKQLSAIDGVNQIDVDIGIGTVIVTMQEGAILDEATASKAVKAAGFAMGDFEPAQTTE